MILPLGMLRKLRIQKSQKLGLVLVFSVCLLTIGLELFRFVRNITGDTTINNVLYAVINANLTIIISCTPTYRSLWSLWQKSRAKRSSIGNPLGGHTYPRQSEQKSTGKFRESSFLNSTANEGSASPLRDLYLGSSHFDLPPLPAAASRPPSYTA